MLRKSHSDKNARAYLEYVRIKDALCTAFSQWYISQYLADNILLDSSKKIFNNNINFNTFRNPGVSFVDQTVMWKFSILDKNKDGVRLLSLFQTHIGFGKFNKYSFMVKNNFVGDDFQWNSHVFFAVKKNI